MMNPIYDFPNGKLRCLICRKPFTPDHSGHNFSQSTYNNCIEYLRRKHTLSQDTELQMQLNNSTIQDAVNNICPRPPCLNTVNFMAHLFNSDKSVDEHYAAVSQIREQFKTTKAINHGLKVVDVSAASAKSQNVFSNNKCSAGIVSPRMESAPVRTVDKPRVAFNKPVAMGEGAVVKRERILNNCDCTCCQFQMNCCPNAAKCAALNLNGPVHNYRGEIEKVPDTAIVKSEVIKDVDSIKAETTIKLHADYEHFQKQAQTYSLNLVTRLVNSPPRITANAMIGLPKPMIPISRNTFGNQLTREEPSPNVNFQVPSGSLINNSSLFGKDKPTQNLIPSLKRTREESTEVLKLTWGADSTNGSSMQGNGSKESESAAAEATKKLKPVGCENGSTNVVKLRSHAEKLHKCLDCEKSFDSTLLLSEHQKVHSNVKNKRPLKCGVCRRTFKHLASLTDHHVHHVERMQRENCMTEPIVHNGESPPQSPTSEKSYNSSQNLTASQHEKQRHVCLSCGNSFANASGLRRHLTAGKRTANGENPLKCITCQLEFTCKPGFIAHQNEHAVDGETSLTNKCGICGKTFKHPSRLITHLNIHNGESPHKCSTCGKCFTYGAHLRKHLKVKCGNELNFQIGA